MLFNLLGQETRSSLENPTVWLSDASAWHAMFGGGQSFTGERVDEVTALGVPAIFAAINSIAGTLAHLPLQLYRTEADGAAAKATADSLYHIVHDRPNDAQTKYEFTKWLGSRLLLDGRAIAQVVRNRTGKVAAIVPVPLASVLITQALNSERRLTRSYAVGASTFSASDILDFVWLPQGDGVSHYCPLDLHKNSIGAIIAAERYAARLFENGGIPAMVLEGPPMSPQAAARATEDIDTALRAGRDRKRQFLTMPTGFKLNRLGFNPSEQQLIDLRKWQVSEVSRIFNIAPAMLHDLTTGTYSNVEQQNLNFAQHTIAPLAKLIEQEMNAKLFGASNRSNYVEYNLDGLQRGAYLDRMRGLASAVNTSLLTPDEARAMDNRPPMPGGDQLYIQGATRPLTAPWSAPAAAPTPDPKDPENDNGNP